MDDLSEICDLFVKKFFHFIFILFLFKKSLSSNLFFLIHSKWCMQSFVMDEITVQDVSNSIDNIKCHFAPGVDGISPKFIKLAKPILSPHLASCCCRSAVLKTRSYNQCLLAISVDSLAKVKHKGVVALKRFSISAYKHR